MLMIQLLAEFSVTWWIYNYSYCRYFRFSPFWTSLNKVDIFKVDVEVEWKFFEIQRSQEWQKKGTGIAQNGNENNAGFWKFVVLINNWEMS